jgi:hypothetical protein
MRDGTNKRYAGSAELRGEEENVAMVRGQFPILQSPVGRSQLASPCAADAERQHVTTSRLRGHGHTACNEGRNLCSTHKQCVGGVGKFGKSWFSLSVITRPICEASLPL